MKDIGKKEDWKGKMVSDHSPMPSKSRLNPELPPDVMPSLVMMMKATFICDISDRHYDKSIGSNYSYVSTL